MSKHSWWVPVFVWAGVIFSLTTTPQIRVTENSFFQAFLMMAGHFVFFGLEAVFLVRATDKAKMAVGAASAYGLFIEFYQHFYVPGRTADPVDWLLDTAGAITFLVIMNKINKKN